VPAHADEFKPVRVAIEQPSLAKYRVPVFAELARRPEVASLVIDYGNAINLPNAPAEGFDAEPFQQRRLNLLGRTLEWHHPMWTRAGDGSCDVLIFTWNLHFTGLVPALLRARRNGVATILWGHGYSKAEASWRSWPRNRVTSLADGVLVYNHGTADALVASGLDRERVHTALNTVDLSPVATARRDWLDRPEDLAAWRRERNLVRENGTLRPFVLFVSRLEEANEVERLLRAAALLSKRPELADLRVAVVGKGPNQEDLRRLGNDVGLGDRLDMPGAIYGDDQLAPYFLTAAESGCFCYPHNVGLSLLHAFGYGCAAVTSDDRAGQNPEIEALVDGQNGLEYQYGSDEALAEVLAKVLTDEPLRQRLSAEALRTAEQKFTLPNMVDGFIASIRSAVGRVRR
jgi:glycosyltransferase involved in cell wall biosynthesis